MSGAMLAVADLVVRLAMERGEIFDNVGGRRPDAGGGDPR